MSIRLERSMQCAIGLRMILRQRLRQLLVWKMLMENAFLDRSVPILKDRHGIERGMQLLDKGLFVCNSVAVTSENVQWKVLSIFLVGFGFFVNFNRNERLFICFFASPSSRMISEARTSSACHQFLYINLPTTRLLLF